MHVECLGPFVCVPSLAKLQQLSAKLYSHSPTDKHHKILLEFKAACVWARFPTFQGDLSEGGRKQ